MNQALALIDAIVRGVVAASLGTPPTSSDDGTCYRIVENATGEWAGHEDEIAVRVGGSWHYFRPFEGLRVHDLSLGAALHFGSSWISADQPSSPTGGTNVDAEARMAIAALSEALRQMGIFAAPS